MRILLAFVVVVLIYFQFQLWVGDGSWSTVFALKQQIEKQQLQNAKLAQRNTALKEQVKDLKTGTAAIEDLARYEMGMIKENEVYYQIVESTAKQTNKNNNLQ